MKQPHQLLFQKLELDLKFLLRQTYGLRDERFFTLKLYALHHSRLTLLG